MADISPILLRVAIPSPLRRTFDYLLPSAMVGESLEAMRQKLLPGVRLRVPFGKREVVAMLMQVTDETTIAANKLKAAHEILDESPILADDILHLISFSAQYYHHAIGDVVFSALPVLLRQGRDIALHINEATQTDHLVAQTPLTLNEEQQAAKTLIEQKSQQFSVTLIEGVTGSGKTEVYLQVIEAVLARGEQVLVLVPEIGLTPQTCARFEKRFNTQVVSLHSGLTNKKRMLAWQAAAQGNAGIIIGTRSAVFTPCPNLGMIIIDEEHDASFKQHEGFRYHARDLCVVRAKMRNIPVVMGSATPSIESYHNAKLNRYQYATLKHRAGGAVPPHFRVVDVRGQSLQEGLSGELFNAIETHRREGGQVMLFVNRRGYAPSLMCHGCGWVASCARCDAHMTLHYQTNSLRCHHCETVRPIETSCPNCQANSLIPIGQGTERVEHTLAKRFVGHRIARIDRDSTSKKGALEAALSSFELGETDILIGTQMLAKGHHFPNLTLVAIIDIEGGLYSSDFRAVERMAQLIMQVAGRAGREQRAGEVILQTHNPNNPLLGHLIKQDYGAFMQALLRERETAHLPPYSYLALFRADSPRQAQPMAFLQSLREYCSSASNDAIQVLGPIPSSMEKRAGRYRAQLLCLASRRQSLAPFLRGCLGYLEASKKPSQLRWSVDVDPMDMY